MLTKNCPKCMNELPIANFGVDNRAVSGLRSWCKPCSFEARKKSIAKKPEYYKRVQKNKHLVAKYGLSLDQFESMLEQQPLCAICGNKFDDSNPARVDHCHATERVRGLLCHNCNVGLGHFMDDSAILRLAIKYLEEG